MKTITKTVETTKEVHTYICEVCGEESKDRWDISSCERKHREEECEKRGKHSWTYSFKFGGWEDCYINSLYRYCNNCGTNRSKDIDQEEIEKYLQANLAAYWEKE